MKTRPQPKRPVTKAVEALIQPHRVTGFACNICDDIMLLASGVTTISPDCGIAFLEPDNYARMEITHKQLSFTDADKFYQFLKKHDDTVTMQVDTEKNTTTFNLSCDACLEKIVPIFKEVFLEKIKNPDFLKPYQQQSAWYFELPEEKIINEDRSVRYYQHAKHYYRDNHYVKAIKCLTFAIKNKPTYIEAYLLRAEVYFSFLEEKKAIEDAKKVLALNPTSAQAYNIIGLVSGDSDINIAIENFNKAIELDKNNAHLYKANIHYFTGMRDYWNGIWEDGQQKTQHLLLAMCQHVKCLSLNPAKITVELAEYTLENILEKVSKKAILTTLKALPAADAFQMIEQINNPKTILGKKFHTNQYETISFDYIKAAFKKNYFLNKINQHRKEIIDERSALEQKKLLTVLGMRSPHSIFSNIPKEIVEQILHKTNDDTSDELTNNLFTKFTSS